METTNATIEVVFAALMLENYTEYVMKEGKALMSDLQDLEEEELAALIAGAGMTNREANQLRKVLKVESRLIAEPIIKTDRTDIQKNKTKSGGLTIAPVANTKSGLERASGKPDTSSGKRPILSNESVGISMRGSTIDQHRYPDAKNDELLDLNCDDLNIDDTTTNNRRSAAVIKSFFERMANTDTVASSSLKNRRKSLSPRRRRNNTRPRSRSSEERRLLRQAGKNYTSSRYLLPKKKLPALRKYLVCNDPKIWVIDDYLSPDLLNYVDQNYTAQLTVRNNKKMVSNDGELDCDFWTLNEPTFRDEIIDALVTLAGIDEIQRFGQFSISDNRLPKDQRPHTDRVSLAWPQFRDDAILKNFVDMALHDTVVIPQTDTNLQTAVKPKSQNSIDLPSKLSPDNNSFGILAEGDEENAIPEDDSMLRCHSMLELKSSKDKHERIRLVPTCTLLVYFCEEDGLVFPKATDWVPSNSWHMTDKGTQVFGKRGRIIMFDNYTDDREANPTSNPKAEHFGLYTQGRTKRIFVGGVMSNKNLTHDKNVEKGMLYSVAYRKPPRKPAPNTWSHLEWGDELITVLTGARDSGSHFSLLRGLENTVLRHICLFSAPEPEPEQTHHHGHMG